MSDLKIITTVLGFVQTNCYFAVNEKTRRCLIIDPADDADLIMEKCRELQIEPAAILLTHGHFDHTGAVRGLKDALNLPIYAGEGEKGVLSDPAVNGELMFVSEARRRGAKPVEADVWLKDGELIEAAGFTVKAIAAPGHTAGGVCYYAGKENVLFSGDVLFADSFGRTDLPTGCQKTLTDSIINKLFTLPDETEVYPGHGEPTSIKREKQSNPIHHYK
jgi:glyoxylase-like metal-dependent hydrolase (beta-lactamase superfamily II)